MAAIVIRHNPKATWLTGLAGVCGTARDMVQRAVACVAAVIMIGAVGAALLKLAVQLLSFPAPIAVPGMTLMAAALLNSLRRHLRTPAGHRSEPGHPDSLQRRRSGTAGPRLRGWPRTWSGTLSPVVVQLSCNPAATASAILGGGKGRRRGAAGKARSAAEGSQTVPRTVNFRTI